MTKKTEDGLRAAVDEREEGRGSYGKGKKVKSWCSKANKVEQKERVGVGLGTWTCSR